MIAIALLLAAPPVLSIESPGISVKELVKEMARQTGKPMEADGSVATDRLIVRFHQAPLVDAMQALAAVEVGKWMVDGPYTYFRKDLKEDERLRSEQTAKLVNGWADMLKKFESHTGPSDYSAAVASLLAHQLKEKTAARNASGDVTDFIREEEAKYSTPMGRALVRVLEAIGPEHLAEFPSNSVEFATDPSSLQQPIGGGGASIIQTYVQEEAAWDQGSAASSDLPEPVGLILELNTFRHEPGGVSVLSLYDRRGRIVQELVTPLNLGTAEEYTKEVAKEQKDLAVPRWAPLPKLSQELYQARDERPSKTPISSWWKQEPAFHEAILYPEKVDYDAETLGRQALAMADDAEENLIVPEIETLASFLPEGSVGPEKLNVNAFRTRLDGARTPFEAPNWYIVSPTLPEIEFRAGQGFVDREALGMLSRSLDSEGRLELDPLADLVKDCGTAFGFGADFNLVMRVHEAVHPDLPGKNWSANPSPYLEFYGRLSPAQRALARSHGLGPSSLSEEVWAPLLANPIMLEDVLQLKGLAGDARTIYTDPYVFFGSVDARQGTLRIIDSTSDALEVAGVGWRRAMDPKEYATFVKGKGEKENSPPSGYRVMTRQTVKMVFDFNGKASMTLELSCDDPVGTSVGSFSDLPADFRDRFKG